MSFRSDMEVQQKQNIESLAVISRNVETVSQNTHSDVQAIAIPAHRLDSGIDRLLRQGEDVKTTLSNIQFQARQDNRDICRTISDQYHQILQHDRAFPRSLQADLCTALVKFGAEQQLLRNDIAISSQRREGEAEEVAARMNTLVRIVRLSDLY